MAQALQADTLTKRVRDGRDRRTVVADVSLSVDRGELCILRGPSGSGKTTLLAMLGAMLTPTSGEVRLDGIPTSRLRDAHRAFVRRRKVGFVFQDVQLLPSLSVRENVLLPCAPDGSIAADGPRADALLERFGLASLRGTTARALSGGEAARAALCRALVRDPGLLLLDEPTAHLDADHAARLLEILGELAQEGRAIVVATHDPRVFAHPSATKTVALVDGRIVGSGTAS
jgi:putative ABC transport system ATP-binding protein